ncbi:MAG TPA: ATP-binding protein [Candidatus Limnocylindrales bacterium]|nr:ATP-binding protein [Candidatus Limnocylindrales bacterium]
MDGPFLLFVGLLVVVLAVTVGIALDRERSLDAARTALTRATPGDPASGDSGDDDGADVPTLVRRLRDRLDASEFELDQQVRNASYLADLMGVGIVHLDEAGTVDLANAAAHILLRRPPGSLRGRTALETFVDGRVEELIAQAAASGASSGEFRLSGSDSPTMVVRARRAPVRGVWVVLEDVSELRRLQQIRTEFVDNLSHELRTPLSTVSLLAETLARDAEAAGDGVPPRMRERIAKIEVETGHLVQMVNELLDLARIESGGPLVLLDAVDLGQVAQDASERLRLFAERQGLRLVVDRPERLPMVRGDEARLGQVVVNLVHNALKFGRPEDADPGGAAGGSTADPDRAEVRVSVRAARGEVVLSVEDHGVGIPAADLSRIFERFYKVDRVRVRGGGTGLGLAIARHVVEQHGGRIAVESEEGRGSTFRVILPAVTPGLAA